MSIANSITPLKKTKESVNGSTGPLNEKLSISTEKKV
jgi:hypothetical protein